MNLFHQLRNNNLVKFIAFSATLSIIVSFSAFSLIPALVSATFSPGTTLDPNCLPTDPNCTVSITWTVPSFSSSTDTIIGSSSIKYVFKDLDGVIGTEINQTDANLHNIFIGLNTGSNNTTGSYNTAIGVDSLYLNTSGVNNTAVGYFTLHSNTTGSNNSANGNNSLESNTTGSYNTTNGIGSLHSNISGNWNTANGAYALYSNTTGSYNTAIGEHSLYSNTTGTYNIAIGNGTLYSNTTGHSNTANGFYSLYNNTTGLYNSATGRDSLLSNTTGTSNTANGSGALYSNTIGHWNTAVGVNALHSNTVGYGNTSLGYLSGGSLNFGDYNLFLGYFAGSSLATGTNNILIGYNTQAPTASTSNFLNIGNTIYGDLSSGKVGIGTSTLSQALLSLDLSNAQSEQAIHILGASTTRSYIFLERSTSPGSGLILGQQTSALFSSTTRYASAIRSAGGADENIAIEPGINSVTGNMGEIQIVNRFVNSDSSYGNLSSPTLNLLGRYWDGQKELDGWTMQDIVASGTSPTSTLKFSHYGTTSGRKQYAFMDGNVGIGTLSPEAKIEINSSGLAESLLALNASSVTNGYARITYRTDGPVAWLAGAYHDSTGDRGFDISNNYLGPGTWSSRFNITNSGNIGIGTTSPLAKLDIWGNLNIATGSVPTLFANTATGNVGIGTNNPITNLHLVSHSAADPLNGDVLFQKQDGFLLYMNEVFSSISPGYSPQFVLKRARGTIATPEAVAQGDQLGLFSFRGYDGTAYQQSARLSAYIDGSVTSGHVPTALAFYAGENGLTGARMTITSNGNIGIGTSSPLAKLDVWGNLNIATGSVPTLFANTATGNVGIGTNIPDYLLTLQSKGNNTFPLIINGSTGSALVSVYDNSGAGQVLLKKADYSNAIALNATGNSYFNGGRIGIGTTTPVAKLHVVGGAGGATSLATAVSNAVLKLDYASNEGIGMNMGFINSGGGAYQYIQPANGDGTLAYNLSLNPYGGNVGIGATSPLAMLHIYPNTNTTKSLIVQGDNNQSANIQEWQKGNGTTLSYVNSNGDLVIGVDKATTSDGAIWIQPNVTGITHASLIKSSIYTLLGIHGGGGPWIKGWPYIWLGDPSDLSHGIIQISQGYSELAQFNLRGATGNAQDLIRLNDSDNNRLVTIQGDGKFGIGTSTPSHLLTLSGGAYSDGSAWTDASSQDLKTIQDRNLSKEDILNKINSLNITRWNYKTDNSTITHIGPMAEDFYDKFAVGQNNKSIAALDTAGIALIGIQALNQDLISLNDNYNSLDENLNVIKENLNYIFGTTSLATLASSTGNIAELSVSDFFVSMIRKAITQISSIFISEVNSNKINTSQINVGSEGKPSGITIYDRTTKQPYCMIMDNGEMITISGTCAEVDWDVTLSKNTSNDEKDTSQIVSTSTTSTTTTSSNTTSSSTEVSSVVTTTTTESSSATSTENGSSENSASSSESSVTTSTTTNDEENTSTSSDEQVSESDDLLNSESVTIDTSVVTETPTYEPEPAVEAPIQNNESEEAPTAPLPE